MAERAHILVVDDDDALLEAVKVALEDDGYGVTTHRDGHIALNWLYEHRLPNLILMDLRLPTMSGWTFWSRVRFLRGAEQIPVVVLSGNAALRDRVLSVGASGFLTKPFSLEELLEQVTAALSSPPPEGGPAPLVSQVDVL